MFTLSPEDADFAEFLATLKAGDWARMLSGLSEESKQALRAQLGKLIGEFEMGRSSSDEHE